MTSYSSLGVETNTSAKILVCMNLNYAFKTIKFIIRRKYLLLSVSVIASLKLFRNCQYSSDLSNKIKECLSTKTVKMNEKK